MVNLCAIAPEDLIRDVSSNCFFRSVPRMRGKKIPHTNICPFVNMLARYGEVTRSVIVAMRAHHILYTPKLPLLPPFHGIPDNPDGDEDANDVTWRAARASPSPTASRVSVGLMTPSSQRRAVAYKEED